MSRRRKCSRKTRHITGNSNRYFFGLELLTADYLYQPENHKWVYWEDGKSCWGQSWCSVHTLAAAIHHLKKHKELPAGTKAVLVSGYRGKPNVILTVRKSWRESHTEEVVEHFMINSVEKAERYRVRNTNCGAKMDEEVG